jgi:hypothetical protein
MLFLIIISCIAMVGMAGFSIYAHERSYSKPYVSPDPMELRVQDLKSRILRMQRERSGKELTIKQIVTPTTEYEDQTRKDTSKQEEMSDLRAKLMTKPKKSLWTKFNKKHDDPIMDELERMQQADLELQESIKNALGKKRSS